MMLIGCRNCGGRYSANLPACPHCETPAAIDSSAAGHVAESASAPARASRPAVPLFSPARELRWARSWAIACGSMLLGGFLMPVIMASAFGLPEYY